MDGGNRNNEHLDKKIRSRHKIIRGATDFQPSHTAIAMKTVLDRVESVMKVVRHG